jgi:hypothetical protein
MKFLPTPQQQNLIVDMVHAGMSSERIATALGISPGVFTAWVSRLDAARALDPVAVEDLLHPMPPVTVQPPPAERDPRIVAERMFATAAE